MRKMLRGWTAALVLASVVLFVAAPAAAAPSLDRPPTGAVGALQLFDELVTALSGWIDGLLGGSPLQHVTARGGHTVDPNGSNSPAPAGAGTVTMHGGHTVDPNG